MKLRSFIVICAVSVLLASVAVAQTSAPEKLLGTWEGQRGETGLSTTLSFRPDGTLVVGAGMMLDFAGRMQGDELLATDPDSGQPVRIRATADSLTFTKGS